MRVIRGEEDIREGLAALAVTDPRLLPVIDAAGPVPLRLMEPGFAGLAFIMAELTALPGIGPWTAEVYLMFCAGHPDVFPSADVALQASLAKAFGLQQRPSAREVTVMAEAWTPWRSVAARLFWAYYAATLRREVMPASP